MADRDFFGNLVDENGHDILEDEEGFDLEDEFADDFPFECEYEEDDTWFEEGPMTGDTDLLNEF